VLDGRREAPPSPASTFPASDNDSTCNGEEEYGGVQELLTG
jgi:hypothetical protein